MNFSRLRIEVDERGEGDLPENHDNIPLDLSESQRLSSEKLAVPDDQTIIDPEEEILRQIRATFREGLSSVETPAEQSESSRATKKHTSQSVRSRADPVHQRNTLRMSLSRRGSFYEDRKPPPRPSASQLKPPPSTSGAEKKKADNGPGKFQNPSYVPGRESLAIDIAPGITEIIRGATETYDAIREDFYAPAVCFACDQMIFAIQNSKYVLCPSCRVVSPMDSQQDGCYGVGLGFTLEQLAEWQDEILRERRNVSKYR